MTSLLSHLAPSYDEHTLRATTAELIRRHRKAFRTDGKHKRSIKPGRFDAEVGAESAAELKRLHHDWWAELGYA